MGYTHYWKSNQDNKLKPEHWLNIIHHTRLSLIDQFPQIKIERVHITNAFIEFNGLDNQGHEDFWFTTQKTEFSFCKTARKPYDLLVVGVLLLANHYAPNEWIITSDGTKQEWQGILDTITATNPFIPRNIQIPKTILD